MRSAEIRNAFEHMLCVSTNFLGRVVEKQCNNLETERSVKTETVLGRVQHA